MEKVDFHTHTTASDGIYTPEELIDYAIENGLVALAITDHDSIDGLVRAVNYAGNLNFRLITGIEFSIEYDSGTFHMVGLGIEADDDKIIEKTKLLQSVRDNRARRMIEELAKYNINITIEQVMEISPEGSIGRPHIARAMVENGYADNTNDVFKNYIVKGKPGYVKKERINLGDAVSLIRESGGFPIIAHPISLNFNGFDDFEIMLKDFIEKGVAGIEAYSPMHTLEEVNRFRKIAEKYDLMISGGSDYHGDKDANIGYYSKNMPIPIEILDNLEKNLK